MISFKIKCDVEGCTRHTDLPEGTSASESGYWTVSYYRYKEKTADAHACCREHAEIVAKALQTKSLDDNIKHTVGIQPPKFPPLST
jgi:hypothetical protein